MAGRRAADAASAFGRLSTATTPQPPDTVAPEPPDAPAPQPHGAGEPQPPDAGTPQPHGATATQRRDATTARPHATTAPGVQGTTTTRTQGDAAPELPDTVTSQPHGTRASRPRGTATPQPQGTPRSGSQSAVAPQPPDAMAPRGHDTIRRVIRKFAVRLYDATEDDALNRLRRELRNLLGRTPSASETAAAALVVADADPAFRQAVAEQICRHPRREGEPGK